jgi:hypothetical protein
MAAVAMIRGSSQERPACVRMTLSCSGMAAGIKNWFGQAFAPHPTALSNLVKARFRLGYAPSRQARVMPGIFLRMFIRKRIPHLLLQRMTGTRGSGVPTERRSERAVARAGWDLERGDRFGASPDHRLRFAGSVGIQLEDPKNTKGAGITHSLLYHADRTSDPVSPRSFVAFVHFVVSLAEDLGSWMACGRGWVSAKGWRWRCWTKNGWW